MTVTLALERFKGAHRGLGRLPWPPVVFDTWCSSELLLLCLVWCSSCMTRKWLTSHGYRHARDCIIALAGPGVTLAKREGYEACALNAIKLLHD